ncbi:Uncharacterised protein [Vibrio cholerae]|nr:Uncharacterised protein [Vibrio cholerae]
MIFVISNQIVAAGRKANRRGMRRGGVMKHLCV